ncbi:Nin one binding Zn-ribbon like-domain-containing protein [Amylostereum chailletii]|nr:Nin one binding Zn-ribbon like-domain-containing protein [Amylostereum chailletii]
MISTRPACKHLVLDAGPLLSLSPLRGLAETYVTVPQVLDELKDPRAREHLRKLSLTSGVDITVQSPDPTALAHVIQFAKKTGDYSVLSFADLSIIALTYALSEKSKLAIPATTNQPATSTTPEPSVTNAKPRETAPSLNGTPTVSMPPSGNLAPPDAVSMDDPQGVIESLDLEAEEGGAQEPLNVELHPIQDSEPSATPSLGHPLLAAGSTPLYDDLSDEEDGEGEWITPSNVSIHKSRELGLTPTASGSGKNKKKGSEINEALAVGCMTADFAMQNVLLQMGLNLVGVEGRRIEKVKTWVLRCHACFEICKDSSKKFCPSCGNTTLLRTSVTLSSPTASSATPAVQIHLKQNFQYKTRGTIYSIPAPKPGSAKTGSGDGLILREDQSGYMRAQKRVDAKKQRDEKKMLNGAMSKGDGALSVGNWMDPDWIPDIISAGANGKGRNSHGNDLPVVGYGRKNPNERKYHK